MATKKKINETPVKPDTFGTDDFYLAAFLVVKTIKLVSFDPTNPQRVVFIFEDSPERVACTEEFLLGRGLIEPKHYSATQKDLKRLIREGQSLSRYAQ
jgi:hypothetical protein